MEEYFEAARILRITEDGVSEIEDSVVREVPLTIFLNNEELVTLVCSPGELDALAAGFLASEGLLADKDDIKKLLLDSERGIARVTVAEDVFGAGEKVFHRLITSGCGKGASFTTAADLEGLSPVKSTMKISAGAVFSLVREFQHRSELYRATGGVHSAALCSPDAILYFTEDIGRHNAVDKIFGRCLLDGVSTDDSLLVTSGRISSEILLKVAKRGVPVIISKSAPTNQGVALAEKLGITLIGFVRGKRMNIYTNPFRVQAVAAGVDT